MAEDVFENALSGHPHQKRQLREEVSVSVQQLLDFRVPGGTRTEVGLRTNINIGLQYPEAWLRGNGAVGINNLMEDAATAEISRSQIWQSLHHGAHLEDGRIVTVELYDQVLAEEVDKIKNLYGEKELASRRLEDALKIFDLLIKDEKFIGFLTLIAYDYLE